MAFIFIGLSLAAPKIFFLRQETREMAAIRRPVWQKVVRERCIRRTVCTFVSGPGCYVVDSVRKETCDSPWPHERVQEIAALHSAGARPAAGRRKRRRSALIAAAAARRFWPLSKISDSEEAASSVPPLCSNRVAGQAGAHTLHRLKRTRVTTCRPRGCHRRRRRKRMLRPGHCPLLWGRCRRHRLPRRSPGGRPRLYRCRSRSSRL